MERHEIRLETVDKDLRALVEGEAQHCISLYVPVDTRPDQQKATELHFRAALGAARERLRERGLAEADADARIAAFDAAPGPEDLEHGARTVALFADDTGCAWAVLPEELPARCAVAPEFALRPLLRVFRSDARFRVLAVSTNRVAAYQGDASGLQRLEAEGLPESMVDALGGELDAGTLSFRNARPIPGQRARGPVFHGHGGAPDERSVDRERFHRALGAALDDAWGGSGIPVVLAAEVRTASALRQHARLTELLGEDVRGNPDALKAEDLHAQALEVVRRAGAAREAELREDYERAASQGKAFAGGVEALAEAALAGRVRRLWVEEEARVPGRIDHDTGRVAETNDPDEDAIDGLTALTLRRGGKVFVVGESGTPTGGPCCAELR